MTRAAARLIGATVLLTAGAVHAEAPPDGDPVAIAAGRALPPLATGGEEPIAIAVGEGLGLEPLPGRRGLVVTVGVAPVLQHGIGVEGIDGLGAGVDLRLAEVAGPRWLLGIELTVGGVVRRPAPGAARVVEQTGALLASGQYYARPGLWLRVGGGLGAVTRRDEVTGVVGASRGGVSGLVGAGLSLVQGRRVGLGLELYVVGSAVRGALAGFGALGLALTVD